MSTGDRTILGKISKRGNRYLRVLFVQAAWVVLIKPKIWERHGLKPWIEAAKKRLIRVPVHGNTVPHPIVGRYGAGRVLLKPAPDGTGIIAGAAVRAVVEAAGVTNVLTKSLGSANPHNVVRAAFTALQELKDPQKLMRLRGKDSLQDLAGGRSV